MTDETLDINDEATAVDRALGRIDRIFDEVDGYYAEDPESALRDMLADLRHYAHEHDLDFYGALDSAYEHYREEQMERRDRQRKIR